MFTVRDDNRAPSSRLLYVLPVDSYQAYNTFGGKSLYFGTEGDNTVSGTSRAVKVSFNRPLVRAGASHDWFFGPDFDLLSWLEQQGYDVSYTDDVQIAANPGQLLQHNAVVISGHSEYWSKGQFDGVKAARDAGVNIASFSANTAYWKVRYEDGERTLVCYKTVEGGGSSGSRRDQRQRLGPGRIAGHRRRRARRRRRRRHRRRQPAELDHDLARQRGAARRPRGSRRRPGRSRPAREPALRRDVRRRQRRSRLPGHRARRATPTASSPATGSGATPASRRTASTNIGTNLVGWEWDAIPTQAQYTSRQPANVIRLSATNVQVASDNSWIQDEGRLRNTTPPPGQPARSTRSSTRAPSGAWVFASGHDAVVRRALRRRRSADRAGDLQHLLRHGGAACDARDDITLDPAAPTRRRSRPSRSPPIPAKSTQTVTFNASGSSDPDGSIVKYEWDLDGDGTFETNSGTNPIVTHTYTAEGEGTYNVRLRVTDNGGATDLAVRTLTVIDNQPPTAAFTVNPNPVLGGQQVTFNGSGSTDPDGTIAKYEWDLDGNGTYETNTGSTPTATKTYSAAGHGQRRPAGHRQRRQDRDHDRHGPGQARRRQQLSRRGARHPRPHRLLAHGRGERPDLRRQRWGEPGHRVRERSHLRRARRRRRATPTPRPGSTARPAAASAPVNLSRHQQGDGRVLAEVELTPTTTASRWSSPTTSTTTTAAS